MTAASLGAGFELMLVGMGTVFVFLTLLVFATTAMSALVARPATDGLAAPALPGGGPSDEELAVIGAAVARHRQRPSHPI